MSQTYRTDDFARWGAGQGFNLSPAQVDNNFWDLIQRMIAQESRPDPAPGISYFSISGVMLYVHMTDDTVLGPYQLPIAIYRDRGAWAPSTIYSVMDTFSINGGLYVVIFAHTSDTSFDPGANDGAGNDYYQLMFQTPGSSLPGGGAVGQLLKKASAAEYSVMWGYTDAAAVTYAPSTGSGLTADNVADALDEIVAGVITSAANVPYTPSTDSGLTSTNVQDAIDEIAGGATVVGRQTIWVPASAMSPTMTSGAAANTIEMTTNKTLVKTLDFDATTAEHAQFDIAMPKSYDLSSLYYKVFWSHATTTTNFGVTFTMDMCAVGEGDVLDRSFVAPQSVTDIGGSANVMYVSVESSAITLGPTYEDMLMFRISRTPSDAGDTLAIDARLHGIQLYYTTNAATDD